MSVFQIFRLSLSNASVGFPHHMGQTTGIIDLSGVNENNTAGCGVKSCCGVLLYTPSSLHCPVDSALSQALFRVSWAI